MITGGRFTEFHYMDSFWMIEGLLASEMYDVRLTNQFKFSMNYKLNYIFFISDGSRYTREFPFINRTIWICSIQWSGV